MTWCNAYDRESQESPTFRPTSSQDADFHQPSPYGTDRAATSATPRSVLLLSRLALIHAPQDLGLLVLDGLVDLCAARGLVAMHLGREGRVVLAGDLLLRLLLAAAVLGVVLVLGGREAVGYAALVLCGASPVSLTRAPNA